METPGFYISLGCKRLSDLVQKEYGTTQETHGNRKAQDIKSLVLERLPLFLHEHNHTTTRVSLTWLNDKGNFVVRTFKRLTVTRNINFAGIKLSKSTETSAVVTQEGKGAIQLWLTDDMEVDMYDIATSFCHLFFDTYKVSDAWLFTTILSTDLHTLQKRGYNGDYKVSSFFSTY